MATDFIAGCIGGCAGVIVGHPFDTVKVRLQTQSVSNPVFKGTFDCFATTIKKESFFGLYKGLASPLYGQAAINAIIFGVQGNVQRRLPNPDSILSHGTAGAVAGLAQSVICSPMELAKTRLQIQGLGESRKYFRSHRHTYKGPADCLKKIYIGEGVVGVFRGFGVTVLREVPSFFVSFASFEYFCRKLSTFAYDASDYEDNETPRCVSTPVLMLAGGFSGMLTWMSTYPADVIKSRMQADMSGKYTGFVDCCRKSHAELGVRVFYRGLGATLLRAFPVNAAIFACATLSLRWMTKNGEGDYDDAYYQASVYAMEKAQGHSDHIM